MGRYLRFFLAGAAIPVATGAVAFGAMALLMWHGLWLKAFAGLLLIGLGAGLLVWALSALRGFAQPRPEAVAVRIIRLARIFRGELTLGQITAGLFVSEEEAKAAIDLLIADGVCVAPKAGEERYRFPGIAPRGSQ